MKKIFNNVKLLAGLLSTIFTLSLIGLVVYANDPGQSEPTCSSYDNNRAGCDLHENCARNFSTKKCDNSELSKEILHISAPDGIYAGTDGSGNQVKTLIFGNTGITIRTDHQGFYKWGASDPVPGGELLIIEPYLWGGSEDNESNGYSPNPDLNSMIARRGPCDAGYHVPSAGEWSKLVVTWCSLYTDCSPNNHLVFNGANNLAALTGDDGLINIFENLLNNMHYPAWSSTPYLINTNEGETTAYRINNANSYDIGDMHDEGTVVRCMKNEVLAPEYFTLTFNGNGGSIQTGSIINILSGDVINLNNYTASKDGYDHIGWATSSNATDPLLNNYVVTGNVTLYAIFKEKWNTATFIPNDDGSKTITYDGKSYTLASSDLAGTYKRGNNIAGNNTAYNGATNNNRWGGGDDNASNGYDSGNSRIQRQGPCSSGYHVPSRGERNAIVIAWCHLGTNSCTSSDLGHAVDRTASNNLIELNNFTLTQEFRTFFDMLNVMYWSSSPFYDDNGAYTMNHSPDEDYMRDSYEKIRCLKNPLKTVSFNANGGTTTPSSVQIAEGETLDLSQYTASKDGYTFVGWNTSSTATTKLDSYVVDGDVTLYAIFSKNSSGGSNSGGGSSSSGGGGRKSSSTNTEKQTNTVNTGSTTQNNTDKSDVSKTDSSKEGSSDNTKKQPKIPELNMGRYDTKYSFDMNLAYQFAYAYGITNKSPISKANMAGKLTRIQMAKMLSNYAINVLGMEPDISKGSIKFSDVSNKLDKKYSNGVTLAYQLGIMGQNIKSNRFRPYDYVTRAEFATALSRMLYGTKDGTGKTKYYEPHMAKLYNEGIIFKRDPNMKEKRGYVMLMLMRGID